MDNQIKTYISEIQFNNGQLLEVKKNDIVLFVGPIMQWHWGEDAYREKDVPQDRIELLLGENKKQELFL